MNECLGSSRAVFGNEKSAIQKPLYSVLARAEILEDGFQ